MLDKFLFFLFGFLFFIALGLCATLQFKACSIVVIMALLLYAYLEHRTFKSFGYDKEE